jgi:ATP-dependent Clp protease adaptor protein ClpS
MAKERTDSFEKTEQYQGFEHELILFNDDVNTFDFVIETLIDVCGHDPVTAEQCALVAHFNGKCMIKAGDTNELNPMAEEMTDRGLTVSIK